MNIFAIISSIFLLVAPMVTSQSLSAPQNVTGIVASTAVVLTWDAVEEAEQYNITIYEGQSIETGHTQAVFGGLEPNTMYTITVVATDKNRSVSSPETVFTFKTLLPKVSNLRVVVATETDMEVTWDERNTTTGYAVVVKNDEGELMPATVDVDNNVAFISGLEKIKFYRICVTPSSDEGLGETAILRARTDGSGVKMGSLWTGYEGVVHGGDVMVYRPLVVPTGPYTIKLTFTCPLDHIKVWNAKVVKEVTDQSAGVVVVRQRKQWQKKKTMIGINFYLNVEDSSAICDMGNDSVSAVFGDEVTDSRALQVNSETTEIATSMYEWLNTSRRVVKTAGIVKVLLMDVYNTTGTVNATFPKPAYQTFIIEVDAGSGCPGGVVINRAWSMTEKSKEGMKDAVAQKNYFVQEGDDWYSNEPGFLYGYDPKSCPNRSEIKAQVLVGGPFVETVVNAKNAEEDKPKEEEEEKEEVVKEEN